MQFDEHSICRPRCYLLPQIHSLCALSIVYDSWKKIHLKDNPKGKKRDLTFGFILCIVSFLFYLFVTYFFKTFFCRLVLAFTMEKKVPIGIFRLRAILTKEVLY